MIKERRACERFSIDGHTVLKPENDKSRSISADLRGISLGGFNVDSREKIEPGTYVIFELALKSSDEVFGGRGRIIYLKEITIEGARSVNMGVEFVNIDNKKLPDFIRLIQHDIKGKLKQSK